MTGTLQWTAVGSSKRTGRADEAGVWCLYVMQGLDCVEISVGDDMVESLRVRIKGKANNRCHSVSLWESSIDYPARRTTLMKYALIYLVILVGPFQLRLFYDSFIKSKHTL